MKQTILLMAVAFTMCGCYTYKTTHTIKTDGKECSYTVHKSGNALVGYSETDLTNEKRSEKDCNAWISK